MTLPRGPGAGNSGAPIPALVVGDAAQVLLEAAGAWRRPLILCDRVAELSRSLERTELGAVLIQTRDADGTPVPAGIRSWVAGNHQVPIIVLTGGSAGALREILDLTAAGGDVRLVLHPRADFVAVLGRLLAEPELPHPGAVPSLLRGVVLAAPPAIQPELTLGVYHAWPHPNVAAWAATVGITRQALNRRLGMAGLHEASVVLQYFTAAEIAIRLTRGLRLREIAAAMGRPDERSLRRRLVLLRVKAESLRDEADFRALIPRVAAGIRRHL